MSEGFTLREAMLAAVTVIVDKHPIPALKRVWLGEGHVVGSDGALTIQVPCDVPFEGGVDGKVLLQILGKDESEATFEIEDKTLNIKQGKRKRVQLPLQNSSARLSGLLKLNKKALSLPLEACDPDMLINMSKVKLKDALIDGEVGNLVIEPADNKILFYSTDRRCIHRGSVETDCAPSSRRVIPLRFLELLNKFKNSLEGARLYVDDRAVFVLADNGFCIHSVITRVKTTLNFERAMNNVFVDGKRDSKLAFKLPDTFAEALQRAKVILALEDDLIKFVVYKNRLTVNAESRKGSFSESFKLKGEFTDAECEIVLKTILRVAPKMRKMSVSEHGIMLYGPGRFMCAISSKKGH